MQLSCCYFFLSFPQFTYFVLLMHAIIYGVCTTPGWMRPWGHVDIWPSEIFWSLDSICASFCCRSASSPLPEKSTRNRAMMESTIYTQGKRGKRQCFEHQLLLLVSPLQSLVSHGFMGGLIEQSWYNISFCSSDCTLYLSLHKQAMEAT